MYLKSNLLKLVPDDFAVKFGFIILSPVDYDEKNTARSYGTHFSTYQRLTIRLAKPAVSKCF